MVFMETHTTFHVGINGSDWLFILFSKGKSNENHCLDLQRHGIYDTDGFSKEISCGVNDVDF